MRILLDTHLYLWWLQDSKQLTAKAKQWIERADVVFISSVSFWEIVIKQQIGKLDANLDDLISGMDECGFTELPVKAYHATALASLPLIHRDPFDRMLIAQATAEPLHFLTADQTLKAYSSLVELV